MATVNTWRGRALGVACCLALFTGPAGAQNVITNSDFSQGGEGWSVYDMGSDNPGEVEFVDDPDVCPTEGSEGGCVVVFATTESYTNTLVFQPVTLVAGTPYEIDAQFRMISEDPTEFWIEYNVSTVEPQPNMDWTPSGDTWLGLNWWTGCGADVDGALSEHSCVGTMGETFIPPGTPGEEITYYVGIKGGVLAGQTFVFSLDDIRVEAAQEAFANAAFSWEPEGKVVVNEPVTFDASSSSASGNITSYEWDFGDGSTASGATAMHTFTQLGRHEVTLEITTDEEVTATRTQVVTVFTGEGSAENPLQVPRATTAPVIDGEREAVWDDAQQIMLSALADGTEPTGPPDLTAVAWLLWDEQNLYVFFDVDDDDLNNDSGDTWQDDAVEFYLDGGNEKATTYDTNDAQYEFGWDTESITGNGAGRAEGAEFATRTKDGETGYTVEVLMPLENVGVEPDIGVEFGFEAMVNDDDGGGGRTRKMAWFAPEGVDQASNNPSLFGTVVLVEEISTSAEGTAETPTTFSIDAVYPNPFNPSTTLTLNVRDAGLYTLRVYNVLGQVVEERELNLGAPGAVQVSLEMNRQASGSYIVWVQHQETGRIATTKATLVK